MGDITAIVLSLVGLIAGFAIAHFIGKKLAAAKISEAEQQAAIIIKEAESEAKNIKKEKLLEVKEEWHKRKQEFENETQVKRNKTQVLEKQLKTREESIDGKLETISKKEKQLQSLEDELKKKDEKIGEKLAKAESLVSEQLAKLEQIAGMTRDDAVKQLTEMFTSEAKSQAAQTINRIREEARITAHREAKNVIVQAIQRTASDHSVETTVSVVSLDSDEMKGRIIGREGRNIRAFEAATGVDVIVDDTPEAVILSAFDQFRREVARISLERLIADGRIHPARIEEIVAKVQEELDEEIQKEGENTLIQLGLHGVHNELVKHIGKMKYRSSYGQNLLQHSIEVAYLTGIMAAELGFDTTIAKKAGLMHDIGKTIDKDVEGPHALLGYELTKKYNEHPIVVNAVGSHHEDIEMEHPIAALVQAADAISGARPGARREPLESYVKRLENLENLAKSFEGVAKTYAIQAGREVRVVVEPDKIDDVMADKLSYEISQKIQEEMEYPGQIKVMVIREVRKIQYAK